MYPLKTIIKKISGWGNYPKIKATVYQPVTVEELVEIVKSNTSILARGCGRSYGDSSLSDTVIDMRGLNKIIKEDGSTIQVEAGITLEELNNYLVPKSLFLQVTPGVTAITIGGAIASDVHGKNHIHAGSFFNITESFELVNEDGSILHCSRTENGEQFLKAFGSMGLSGIIISASIKLMPIETTWCREKQFLADSYDSFYNLLEKNKNEPHMVSWADLLNPDFKAVVKTGDWMKKNDLPADKPSNVLTVGKVKAIPFTFPFAPPSMVFKRNNKKFFTEAKNNPDSILHFGDFFFPLNKLKNWNRIYGPNGFLQYHFVLAPGFAKKGMEQAIDLVKRSGASCTLCVVKWFGKANEETPEAFPMEGYNMALDFINNQKAKDLARELDQLVKSLGGKIYKTKDAVSTLPLSVQSNTKFNSIQNNRYGPQKIT